MKKTIITLYCSIFCFLAYAQFGVRATYNALQAPQWETHLNDALTLEQDALDFNTFSYGVDYWFRLKNHRLEFFPTLSYLSSKNHLENGGIRDINLKMLSFHLNTHIYFLSLKGDCDCPTWSKSEPIFEKGLFLLLSPGIDYFSGNYSVLNTIDSVPTTEKSSTLNGSIALGLGLDIGLSDLITITPYGGVRWHTKTSWEGLLLDFEELDPNPSSLRQLFGGIRLGIRLDE